MFGLGKKPEVSENGQDKPAGLFQRLKQQLGKTRAGLSERITQLVGGASKVDETLLEDIEDQLLLADVGVESTTDIVGELRSQMQAGKLETPTDVFASIGKSLVEILEPVSKPLSIRKGAGNPFVILVVGVNGAGKTTTIGKITQRLLDDGLSVMLAAGDTFRAAAIEQLQTWGERSGVTVVAQHQGADSASVVFDAVESARARGVDVLIADTAGRLHTQAGLMEEIKKIHRVIGKIDDNMPHETLLVVDACTGQNAIAQATEFNQAIGLSGIAVTKLDGTAKGGVMFALARKLGIPIRYIGIGEQIGDLRPFDAKLFVDALLETDQTID